jgi:hypothetical protein
VSTHGLLLLMGDTTGIALNVSRFDTGHAIDHFLHLPVELFLHQTRLPSNRLPLDLPRQLIQLLVEPD